MKVTLNDVGNLIDATTAKTTINNNTALIETAFDNTLSRDGTGPNAMEANIDMDSNRILNLVAPVTAEEPLRFQDLSDFVGGGTITNIPVGGSTGDSLVKNSNTNYDVKWTPNSSTVSAGTNIVITGTSPATISTVTNPTFTSPTINTPLGITHNDISGVFSTTQGAYGINVSGVTGFSLFTAGTPTFVAGTGTGNVVRATSPAITTPTGIVKADVGLSNVDNTSDALKPASTAQAALNATYVAGPASAVNSRIPVWNGTTGKLLSDSTYALPTGSLVGTVDSQTLTNKTLTTPVLNGTVTGTSSASTNTASTLVLRDGSGNFSAGTITASLSGNASTVTTNANLTGAVTSSGNATSLGSFTSAALLAALTDETGTGANVFATSPSIDKPAIAGVINASNASAGNYGEFITAAVESSSPVALVTATAKTITSISLTAGDWDVYGNFGISGNTTTTVSYALGGLSLVNNTLPVNSSDMVQNVYGGLTPFNVANGAVSSTTPRIRVNVNSTTTVYLVGTVSFGVAACNGYGKIEARRIR